MKEPAKHRRQRGIANRSRHARIRLLSAALAGAIAVMAPVAAAAKQKARTVDGDTAPDRAAIENLQRWVNAGHDSWCKISGMVASAQLQRIAPEFSGDQSEMTMVPAASEATAPNRLAYTWTNDDGSTTYRVTVERFSWLLPLAGKTESIIWVPTRVEILVNTAPDDGPHSLA